MRQKHARTLEAIFRRPVSANIQWRDIEALFRELGAEIAEREGSRIEVFLFGALVQFSSLLVTLFIKVLQCVRARLH